MNDYFSEIWFLNLDAQLRASGLDSDAQSFDEIKKNLANPKKVSPDQFFVQCVYVILAGGFSQKTAKKIHSRIIDFIFSNGIDYNSLLAMFNNKNKINAICKIWENRQKFCQDYYKLSDTDSRLKYLQTLPHVGKITANHLARNLGENVVKYDIWIQRLGALYAGNTGPEIDNKNLNPKIKCACDEMFNCLCEKTGLPRGYIDVVLWKACQSGLIKL